MTSLKVKDIVLVQLLGCSYQSKYNTDKVVLEFARKLHTVPYTLPLPVTLENAALMDTLLSESRVVQIYELYDRIDIALLTVGWMGVDSTNYLEGFVSKNDLKRLSRMGAVADMCGRYFDIDGNICDRQLYDRTVGIDFERIRRTKLPILVANGDKKVKGIIGALNGGLCKALITDEHTAALISDQVR
jgi:deoxyribonucleoside regulator